MSLPPCPCCRSANVAVVRKDVNDPSPYQVRCLECDCRAGRSDTERAAKAAWLLLTVQGAKKTSQRDNLSRCEENFAPPDEGGAP